jgi:hypothetical protein
MGIARKSMVKGSPVGTNIAANNVKPKTTYLQGRSIAEPDTTPMRFKARRKTGSSNARPKTRSNLRMKTRYSSKRMRLLKSVGVSPMIC